MITFHNTFTSKKEEFKPIKDDLVGIYSCGPTVYWNQHIGHMYAYVQWDSLVRTLNYLGYRTKWVMNLTDVGHLTSDEDLGQDKMEKGAKREGKTVWEIADKYISQFKESLQLLNINEPDIMPRATEHISEQIDLIKKIENNGFAYKTQTGLVFDTQKFPDYANFAKLNLEDQEAGARVKVDPEKKKPWDFLLWVTNQPEHIMKWESPWGIGFPGWHIECTAMSTKYLGETFDIHTGGKEHIPIHHTNEIAQAYGAFGHQTANFWLHNEWMTFDGEKISKSTGNSILITDLVAKGFNPLSLRYLILTSHYKTGLNFTWESLKAAQTALEKIINKYDELPESLENENEQNEIIKKFKEAISDDLNMPIAISLLFSAKDKKTIDEMDRVLGLNISELSKKMNVIPAEILQLKTERDNARALKDFSHSDSLRNEIEKLGYTVEDKSGETKIRKNLSVLSV